MIKAEILADSYNPYSGDRLTTFLLTYPRFIHSELMTHRVFSRNAASSRAIPVERMIRMIEEEPATPVEWGTTQRGMQAGAPLVGEDARQAELVWLGGLEAAVEHAHQLLDLGVHKQIANRLLEPWAHMTTLVSATEFGNFFRLRAHPAAQPEFQRLAYLMLLRYRASIPSVRSLGDWHLPFNTHDRQVGILDMDTRIKVAVARCARTSYSSFDAEFTVEKDVELHDRLLTSGHFSPFEHVARPLRVGGYSGNFRGWQQYRQLVEPHGQQMPLSDREIDQILERRPADVPESVPTTFEPLP